MARGRRRAARYACGSSQTARSGASSVASSMDDDPQHFDAAFEGLPAAELLGGLEEAAAASVDASEPAGSQLPDARREIARDVRRETANGTPSDWCSPRS